MAVSLPSSLSSRRGFLRFASFLAVAVSIAYAQNRLPNRLPKTSHGPDAITALGPQLPAVSQPWDIDGSPSTFSVGEQSTIRRIWQRVADDYAPFVIDVTTEDPGVEALRKTSPGDTAYGTRVVISPTNWYSTSAGGTGYIG